MPNSIMTKELIHIPFKLCNHEYAHIVSTSIETFTLAWYQVLQVGVFDLTLNTHIFLLWSAPI